VISNEIYSKNKSEEYVSAHVQLKNQPCNRRYYAPFKTNIRRISTNLLVLLLYK